MTEEHILVGALAIYAIATVGAIVLILKSGWSLRNRKDN